MDGSDSITACDHCQHQFDIADIYDVEGEQLCEGCKKTEDARHSEWIEINSEADLPPLDTLVLVSDGVNVGMVKRKPRWYLVAASNDRVPNCDVTHWQPLPQPPQ